MTHSKITGNRVENTATGSNDGGGGLTVYGGTVTLRHVDVIRNTVEGANAQGGGITVEDAAAVVNLEHSLVSRNTADGASATGSGIHNEGGAISLRDTPVTANRATNAPGGIWTDTQFPTVLRSPIVRNTPTNCAGSPVIVTGCTDTASATTPVVPLAPTPGNERPNKP